MLSSPGIGSGLDINSLVTQLVAAETQPKIISLNQKEAIAQSEISAIGTLKGALSDFQSSLSSLKDFTNYTKNIAISSNTSLFSTTASSSAEEGSYSVEVTQIAVAQKLKSTGFSGSTTTVGTGTLNIEFGTYNSGPNTFVSNPDKTALNITIDSTNNTLTGIKDAINAEDASVSASIVNDGTNYRLVVTSKDTGLKNSLKITTTDDDANNTDMSGLSQLAYDPTASVSNGKNQTESIVPKDATLNIDGIAITSDTNSITSAVEGVTINLVKAEVGTIGTLNVTKDTASAKSEIDKFVEVYNEITNLFKSLGGYDADTGIGGILQGDYVLRSIERQVRSIASDFNKDLTGPYGSLAEIGILTEKDGSITLDSTILDAALAADMEAVGLIFADGGVTTDPLVKYVSSTDNTKAGTYAINLTAYQPAVASTSGKYTTAINSTLVIDGNNDNFTIEVDGTTSGSISLTQNTYADGDALATQIMNQINADSTLNTAGKSVTVTYVTDHFEITSNTTGTGSTVDITAIDTSSSNIGLSVAAGTAGTDAIVASVAGTMNGTASTGSGTTLTGDSGDVTALKIDVLGGVLGARGTITFTEGIASKIDAYLEALLADDGLLDLRTDRLTDQIDEMTEEAAKINERALKLQARYYQQFNMMDSLLASLNSTSDYLAQQLANLPGNETYQK